MPLYKPPVDFPTILLKQLSNLGPQPQKRSSEIQLDLCLEHTMSDTVPRFLELFEKISQ